MLLRKSKFSILALLLAYPMASFSATWIMATGYPEESFFTKNIRQFAKEVETESAGKLKIDLRTNGTLIKLDDTKRAVQTGQVQAGEIRLGVYGNENAVFNLDGLPNIAPSYHDAQLLDQAWAPYIDSIFSKSGIKAISYIAWPGQGFYTKEKIDSLNDFKKLKLRIYSKPTQKMGTMLGADAVVLPFAEVAQAFATGLINSQFTSAQTGIDTQTWDNVKYYMYTGTLHNQNALIVNERALKKLDPKTRDIVLKAGERATQRGYKLSEQATKDTIEVLKSHGMVVYDAPQDIQDALAKIGTAMVADWRKTADDEQVKVLDTYLKLKSQAK